MHTVLISVQPFARKGYGGFDGVIMSDWNTTVPEDGSIRGNGDGRK